MLLEQLEAFNNRLGSWRDDLVSQLGESTGNVEYTALIKKLVLQDGKMKAATSLVLYHLFVLLNHRLRIALGCDDAPGVEAEVQLIAQSVRVLFQTRDKLRMPFLLPFAMNAALDTSEEWRDFSMRAGAGNGPRVLVPLDIFARWLRATGVNFETEM